MNMSAKFLLAPLLLLASLGYAQQSSPPAQQLQTKPASTPDSLFRAVAAQDAALFDAYNRCDLERFASLLASDIEFYHDHGGVTLGRVALTLSVKKNICGKVTRELVADSLEVYPMDNYGALEVGTHRFHHIQNEQNEPVGQGKFIQLWQYNKKDGTWKITRVFSFDHHSVPK